MTSVEMKIKWKYTLLWKEGTGGGSERVRERGNGTCEPLSAPYGVLVSYLPVVSRGASEF
jgi:hypothetical protein